MFSEISWSEYLRGATILLAVYYTAILLLYYQQEINGLLSGKFKREPPVTPENLAPTSSSLPQAHSATKMGLGAEGQVAESGSAERFPEVNPVKDSPSFDGLEQVLQGIRDGVLEKAGKNADKSELLSALKERLASYDGLRQPAFRIAISRYLEKYAKEICGVGFSVEELEVVWRSLLR